MTPVSTVQVAAHIHWASTNSDVAAAFMTPVSTVQVAAHIHWASTNSDVAAAFITPVSIPQAQSIAPPHSPYAYTHHTHSYITVPKHLFLELL